jgi:hypothetical protein
MDLNFGDYGERIRIVYSHPNEKEDFLPDISYEVFEKTVIYEGSSEQAYDKYLRSKGMKYLTDLNSETTKEISLVVENGFRERRIILKVVEDSDWILDNETDSNLPLSMERTQEQMNSEKAISLKKEIEYKVEYISGRLFTPFFRRKSKGGLKGIFQYFFDSEYSWQPYLEYDENLTLSGFDAFDYKPVYCYTPKEARDFFLEHPDGFAHNESIKNKVMEKRQGVL